MNVDPKSQGELPTPEKVPATAPGQPQPNVNPTDPNPGHPPQHPPVKPEFDPQKEEPTQPNRQIPERKPGEGGEPDTHPNPHIPEINPGHSEEHPTFPDPHKPNPELHQR